MFDSNFHPIQRTMSRCTVFGSMSSLPSLIDDTNDAVYAGNSVVGEAQHEEACHIYLHPLQKTMKQDYYSRGHDGLPCDEDSVPSLIDEKDYDDIVDHRSSHPPIFHSTNSVDFVVEHIIMGNNNIHQQIFPFEEQQQHEESMLSWASTCTFIRPVITAEQPEIPVEIVVSHYHDGLNNSYHMDDGWDIATCTSQDIDVDIPSVLEQLIGPERPMKRQRTMDSVPSTSLSLFESSFWNTHDFHALCESQRAAPAAASDLPQPCLSSCSVNSNLIDILVDDRNLDILCPTKVPSILIPHVNFVDNEMTGGSQVYQVSMDNCGVIECVAAPQSSSLVAETNTAATPKKKKRRQSKRPNYEPPVKVYVIPNDNDVLMGRGGRTNHHPGNHMYLDQKKIIQPKYLAATKEEKTDISQELVDAVHSWGGRFLKQDPVGTDSIDNHNEEKVECVTEHDDNRWYEVLNIVARKKASQTLREVCPQNKKS